MAFFQFFFKKKMSASECCEVVNVSGNASFQVSRDLDKSTFFSPVPSGEGFRI